MRPVIAGNWKMNLSLAEATGLALECIALANAAPSVEVRVYPGAYGVPLVARMARDASLGVGAQNCYASAGGGAFTGEVSVGQVLDAGAGHVLLGHSERRMEFGESDALIGRKLAAATVGGLRATLCVGETLEQRDEGEAMSVVRRQLAVLEELAAGGGLRGRVDVAYEPVWAIGTGQVASSEQAQEMHHGIREVLTGLGGFDGARILYGGSVKPENAAELARCPDVSGFLVGGASLKIESFGAILRNCDGQWACA